jgi:O-methyltransferase
MSKLLHNAGRAVERVASSMGMFIGRYNRDYVYVHRADVREPNKTIYPQGDDSFYRLARPVLEAGRTLLKHDRLYVLWLAARNVYHMELAAAEVGSYRGGSAYFLASAFRAMAGKELPLHVFDTFEGHPEKADPEFDPVHKPGMFSDTDYEEVKAYLERFTQVEIHKGEFSESVNSLPDKAFGLVHIDVDIYRSTLDCLDYFGARLASGGVMVVDDYGSAKCPGVNSAISEYLRRENRFQVWQMQTEQLVLVKI